MKRILLIVLCLLIFPWTPCQSAENVQLARMNPWVAGSVGMSATCYKEYAALDAETTSETEVDFRLITPTNDLGCSGTYIRITVEAHSTSDTILSGTSICERDDSTDDCVATPVRITWGGENTKTIAAGTTAVSDWVLYTFTHTNAHLYHFYMADNGTQYIRRKSPSTAPYAQYYDTTPGGDRTLEQTITSEGTSLAFPFLIKTEVY